MANWKPTEEMNAQYERDGYFVVRGLIHHDTAMEIRGVIKNTILSPEAGGGAQADPMDPMGDSPAARAARFRKLGALGIASPLIWDAFYTGRGVLPVVQHFLGDDLLLKFNSVFLKPARTGSATPWHQDNGLWRDGEIEMVNCWMAIDAATQANGCMQFIPGSQRTPIIEHVLYPDSIHGELPREQVSEMIARHGVHHIELAPGDAVFWHSNLWHFSPPNTSEHGRIAIAGVWTNQRLAEHTPRFKKLYWVMKDGERCEAFPPEVYTAPGEAMDPGPWKRVLAS